MHLNISRGQADFVLPPARTTLLLGLLGAYANAVAYGFGYGAINHEFELPLVNWLRDPSLYPHDAIREAFPRMPTLFWPVVAYLSRWFSVQQALLGFFLLTKVLFFLALARLVTQIVEDSRLSACILFAVALSPLLNEFTPFGTSNILDHVQTGTSLAIALLVGTGVLLIEGRWLSAALASGVAIYANALFVFYSIPAYTLFAVLDWRQKKNRILLAGLIGTILTLPWLVLSRGLVPTSFPKDYVDALLTLYAGHLILSSHPASDLAKGAGLLAAAALMLLVASNAGLRRQRRLELLAVSYLLPVLLGIFLGEFLLTPQLARLQLLRADSFLVLYATVLIQVYGANLLSLPQSTVPLTTLLLGIFAVLLPVSDELSLLIPLFAAVAFWLDREEHFEQLCIWLSGRRAHQWASIRLPQAGSAVAGFGCLLAAVILIPAPSRLWNPMISPSALETDWFEVQRWAKANTPVDAQFLVPTYPGGFRMFSERSSWGEWKDGSELYWYPAFTETYHQRILAIGLPWGRERSDRIGLQAMADNYKRQPWERLLAIARENHLSYVVQFRDRLYPVASIFANRSFAVYKVPK